MNFTALISSDNKLPSSDDILIDFNFNPELFDGQRDYYLSFYGEIDAVKTPTGSAQLIKNYNQTTDIDFSFFDVDKIKDELANNHSFSRIPEENAFERPFEKVVKLVKNISL